MSDTIVMPKSIAQKLVKVLAAVGTIEKRGKNRNQNYEFVQEADLVNKVRPTMADLGLLLHQNTVFHDAKPMYETRSGGTMYLTTVGIAYTWIDGETGEVYPVPGVFYGTGADTGDKGVYKAATGSLKYFLMKTFLIGSGDDPEADEKVDQHAAATAAAGGARKTTVTKASHDGVERGGKSSLATDAQRDELKRIARSMGVTNVADLQTLLTTIVTAAGETVAWDSPEGFVTWLQTLSGKQMGTIILAAERMAAAGGGDDLDLS